MVTELNDKMIEGAEYAEFAYEKLIYEFGKWVSVDPDEQSRAKLEQYINDNHLTILDHITDRAIASRNHLARILSR